MSENNKLQVKTNVGDQVIARINSLCEAGFNMPKDYSYVNAIKMSFLKLQDLKDKNGKSVLEVCTPTSIQTALFQMVTKGLNAALNQCYFIPRGNQLCLQESYFSKILMVKRIYPNWNPLPVVIREGDEFVLGIESETGRKYVIKHETKLENTDNGFVGAYMYLPTGGLFVMTRKQILTAWSKSSNSSQSVHKTFDEKMVIKTLINSGCTTIINSTPDYQMALDEEEQQANEKLSANEKYDDFEDAEFEDVADEHQIPVAVPIQEQQPIDEEF